MIAHGGCTDTVRESAPEAMTLGEKSLASPGTRTRIRIAPGFSAGRSISWAVSAPGKTHKFVTADTRHIHLLQLIRGTTICYSWYEVQPFVTADTRYNHLLQLIRDIVICYSWYETQPLICYSWYVHTTIYYSWYEIQPFVTADTRHNHLLQLIRDIVICYSWYETQPLICYSWYVHTTICYSRYNLTENNMTVHKQP